MGGVLTVIEILSVKHAKELDKTEALKLLICVASAGRQYKEIICEGYGQQLRFYSTQKSEIGKLWRQDKL